jgi:hypothetical protein
LKLGDENQFKVEIIPDPNAPLQEEMLVNDEENLDKELQSIKEKSKISIDQQSKTNEILSGG